MLDGGRPSAQRRRCVTVNCIPIHTGHRQDTVEIGPTNSTGFPIGVKIKKKRRKKNRNGIAADLRRVSYQKQHTNWTVQVIAVMRESSRGMARRLPARRTSERSAGGEGVMPNSGGHCIENHSLFNDSPIALTAIAVRRAVAK